MLKKLFTPKIAKWIGGGMMVLAIISIFVIDWDTKVEDEPDPIRPLKTMLVGAAGAGSGDQYPGQVRANQEVDLAFEVPGKLVELKVKKGDNVKKGQVLAKLDARDYKNEYDAARAEVKRAKAQFERVKEAAAVDAVSKQDLSDARASYDKSKANLRIKKKAVDDAVLYAKFDGIIANRFAENHENVAAKQPILSLQDISSIEIRVDVPERRVAQVERGDKNAIKFTAIFDFFPNREFPVTLKEFTAEADPMTQTFEATFVMKSPKDVNLLPGMTVSIVEHPRKGAEKKEEAKGISIPLDAAPIDGVGQYYVWIVKAVEDEEDIYAVSRRDVQVGTMGQNTILIEEGLAPGDRIALAGVHLLKEGQKVLIFKPRSNQKI